jgi:hypothetical protein
MELFIIPIRSVSIRQLVYVFMINKEGFPTIVK